MRPLRGGHTAQCFERFLVVGQVVECFSERGLGFRITIQPFECNTLGDVSGAIRAEHVQELAGGGKALGVPAELIEGNRAEEPGDGHVRKVSIGFVEVPEDGLHFPFSNGDTRFAAIRN